MKKMYIQPNVEATEVQATSLMQSASPAGGQGINISIQKLVTFYFGYRLMLYLILIVMMH